MVRPISGQDVLPEVGVTNGDEASVARQLHKLGRLLIHRRTGDEDDQDGRRELAKKNK